MKFELTTKTVHNVTITDLELVPADADVWKGLRLNLKPTLTEGATTYTGEPSQTDEGAFEDEWLTEVTRTAIDMLPMHGPLEGVHFYLGHFNEDNKPQVAVLGKEMDNYGADDITYNGWRVTVSCDEVDWGLD